MATSNNYKFLIWQESIDDEHMKLHLVRRHKNNFRQVHKHFKNNDECWYYNFNIADNIRPSHEIKKLVIDNFRGKDYKINDFNIIINKSISNELKTLIENHFQK
ncbi:hypothetical protein M9Y10_013453 [Tritrichomonas musculus]|uniref:Uncharacterized protein n=1 Tax=Tritrichomonas musculus TaxID=1915356 RepID=A0ABR2I988_9EUKA